MHDVVAISTYAGRHAEAPARLTPPVDRTRPDDAPPREGTRDDRVELSEAARDFDDLRAGRVRESLVQRVRAQIADGSYLTDEKIDVAVERLLGALL